MLAHTRVPALTCATILLGALLSLVSAGDSKSGKNGQKNEFPSVKESLSTVVHARKWSVKKLRLDAAYDFSTDEQKKDFAPLQGYKRQGKRWVKATLRSDPGKLYFPNQGIIRSIRSELPVTEWHSLTFWIHGITSLQISMDNDEDEDLWASLSEYASVRVGNDDEENANRYRALNLLEDKTYKIEVLLSRKKFMTKLDGKKVLETRLPKEFRPFNSFTLHADGAKSIYLTGARLVGAVSDDVVVAAANRGRLEAGKPPIWRESFVAEGRFYRVESSVSQESADWWLQTLDGQQGAIDARFPIPADSSADGVDPSARSRVFVFKDSAVIEAYSGQRGTTLLEGDAVAILEQPKYHWALTSTARRLLSKIRTNAPYWWLQGMAQYYAQPNPDAEGFMAGHVNTENVAVARKYVEKGTEPRLSVLLHGHTPKQFSQGSYQLCWAWVHFLEHAEDGNLRTYLDDFYEAMVAGKSATAAGEEVFPLEKFNQLFPRFKSYLESL